MGNFNGNKAYGFSVRCIADDGVATASSDYPSCDSNDNNANVCSDDDGDSCDDCSNGSYDVANDGFDYDGDGACDAGDTDDDNDGVLDGDDSDDNNEFVCSDTESLDSDSECVDIGATAV